MPKDPIIRVKARPEVVLVGTLERVYGVAHVHAVDTATGEIEYAGGTEVWWDGQETVLDGDGKTFWIDEGGAAHALAFDEIEVVQPTDDLI